MIVTPASEKEASETFRSVVESHGLRFSRADAAERQVYVTASLPDLLDFSGRSFTLVVGETETSALLPADPRLRAWARRGAAEFRVFEGAEKTQLSMEFCVGGIPTRRRPLAEARDVCNGGPFGRPALSDDGRIAFIAESAETKLPRGWLREPKTGVVEKFEYCASFGEALTKVVRPKLLVWDGGESVAEVAAPEGYLLASPVFRPQSTELLAVGYHTPSKLNRPGISVCWNRRACVFLWLDLTAPAQLITPGLQLALAPTFSPDGSQCVLVGRETLSQTHCGYLSLWKVDIAADWRVAKIPLPESEAFPGLFLTVHEEARDMVILGDNRTLVFSSNCRAEVGLFRVDLKTLGAPPVKLVLPGSCTLLAVTPTDSLIVVSQTLRKPPQLLRLGSVTDSKPKFLLGAASLPGDCSAVRVDSTLFSSWLVSPGGDVRHAPLIVKLHGGPHVAALNSFSTEIACFLKQGFHVLLPNYRGSGGFGEQFLDALPGHVGVRDVDDCAQATRDALHYLGEKADPARVVAYGGSHGGFLTGWLLGHKLHKSLYSAGVLWNPAVDLLASNLTSDIPEWSVCEVMGFSHTGSFINTDQEFIRRAREHSAISVASEVAVPALVVLGGADLRVDCMAGLRWAQIIEERGRAKVDVLSYPDQGHAISGPECQEHAVVSILAWILDRTTRRS